MALLVAVVSLVTVPPWTNAVLTPSGKNYDHIVIIAMENQLYSSVLGNGTGLPKVPFLSSLLSLGATIPKYHSYEDPTVKPGCSAACYVAFMAGTGGGVSDGYAAGSLKIPNLLADRMAPAGLTWEAFCESGCGRGTSHFPFLGFSDTENSSNTIITHNDFTNSSNPIYAAFNGASPPNLLWLTPTDKHNMHSDTVASGDSYLQALLVGSGTLSSPAAGSLLATNVFKLRTELYIWWDEYDPSPNIQVDFNANIKHGYVSPSNNYGEYASLHTILDNWNLPSLGNSGSDPVMDDIFPKPRPVISLTPASPIVGQRITFSFTIIGGIPPYTATWDYGDGWTSNGPVVQHFYARNGTFTVALKVVDSAGNKNVVSIPIFVANDPAPMFPDGSSLAASDIDARSLILTWTPAVDLIGVTNYRLYINGSLLVTLPTSASSYYLSRLTPLTSYLIQVEAGNPSNNYSTNGPSTIAFTRLQGDVNLDCKVDIFDLTLLGSSFGSGRGDSGYTSSSDLNGDGVVNIMDLILVSANLGRTC